VGLRGKPKNVRACGDAAGLSPQSSLAGGNYMAAPRPSSSRQNRWPCSSFLHQRTNFDLSAPGCCRPKSICKSTCPLASSAALFACLVRGTSPETGWPSSASHNRCRPNFKTRKHSRLGEGETKTQPTRPSPTTNEESKSKANHRADIIVDGTWALLQRHQHRYFISIGLSAGALGRRCLFTDGVRILDGLWGFCVAYTVHR